LLDFLYIFYIFINMTETVRGLTFINMNSEIDEDIAWSQMNTTKRRNIKKKKEKRYEQSKYNE